MLRPESPAVITIYATAWFMHSRHLPDHPHISGEPGAEAARAADAREVLWGEGLGVAAVCAAFPPATG